METRISIVAALAIMASCAAAQTAPSRILGAVAQVSAQGFVVKSDSGESATVAIAPGASLRSVPPGERDLTKATPIQASDIVAGDRVLVSGTMSGPVLMAQQVIVMSAGEIAKKREQERAAWTQRGLSGIVTAVDEKKGEIAIRIPALMGQAQTATVVASPATTLRRYAPGSVRFADAKPSTLTEVKPGDQLRAKGEKSSDGLRLTAEEIVTGSFRTVAGAVVTAGADSIQIKELGTDKMLDIRVTPESTLKRFPVMGGDLGQGRPPVGSGSGPNAASAVPPSGLRQGGPGGPGGGVRRPDLSQMLERLPVTTVAEIKPGDTVVVSSASAGDAREITAIMLLAGAERLIAMQQQQAAATANQAGRSGPAANWNIGDMSSMIPMTP